MHGYGSKKESFYYQINFLSAYFKVTAPDFPCFGASECSGEPWAVDDYADWLIDFMQKSGVQKPHILAHSFGARVAIKLLARDCSVADRVIITGGAGLVKERSPRYMRQVTAYRRIKKLFPKFAEKHFGSEEYRKLSPIMKESYKKIVNEDLREYAKKITNPVYLLYGRDDTVTPPSEEGETFHSLIGGSRFETMDGGHFCFSEHPDLFNKKILNFLSEE